MKKPEQLLRTYRNPVVAGAVEHPGRARWLSGSASVPGEPVRQISKNQWVLLLKHGGRLEVNR
jgi:hypothetical protein